MKKLKSLAALLLVLCLLVTCFAGCQEDTDDADDKPSASDVDDEDKDVVEKEDEPPKVSGTFDDCMMLEQIGVVNRSDFSVNGGGLTYKDSETKKYGIISMEGLYDTGAIYSDVTAQDAYFSVMLENAKDADDLAGLNTRALVTGNGRQIIGPYYAYYDIRGDFAVAYTATKRVSENGAFSLYSGFEGSSSSAKYDGEWVVYSLITGLQIPGIEGVGSFSGYEEGAYLHYKKDDKYVCVDYSGNPAPDYKTMFNDGSYCVESQIGEVFAGDGSKLFAYDVTGYIPYSTDGTYYIAKRYADGKSAYVVMDKSGNVISTEFDDDFTLEGNLILMDGKLMNFQGETVLKGNFDSITLDRMFGQYYVVRADDTYTVIDEEGAVYLSVEYDDDHVFSTTEFVAYEKRDGDFLYYCHKTQSYDINGYSVSSWLVRVEGANYTYELVDTMTGDTLLSGYKNYSYNARNPQTYYIYARHSTGADVYLATSMKGFQSVTQKKEDLFDDLSAAFEEAGLTVTVNRETGELAMDSSVLFGGDSAALTTEGKEFLNTFISVYSNVVYSAKYDGFISSTMIEGHTAPISGSTYASGLPLSQERAANVKDYILSGETGVDLSDKANTFEDVGYSNSQPVYNEDGTVNLDASRRVSFRFLVNVDG